MSKYGNFAHEQYRLPQHGPAPQVKYEVRSPKFIWAPCAQLYTLAEIPNPPPPFSPAFGLINEGAIGQPR